MKCTGKAMNKSEEKKMSEEIAENGREPKLLRRNKRLVRISALVILVLVVFAFALLALHLHTEPEPGVYAERRLYGYDDFYIVMDENGRFQIQDILCKISQDSRVFSGKYYLYESKLVLVSYHKDINLVFTADGDNWIYEQSESEGLETSKFKMGDQAIWRFLTVAEGTDWQIY